MATDEVTTDPDPTRNVLQLVDAAIKRQDDLRESEARHMRELSDQRAVCDGELRTAESDRLDAIRAVDVAAVNRAAEVSATQQAALAAQVAATAEAMRNQVAAAASASVVSQAAALEPIQKDIQDLRKAQYEAQGTRIQVQEGRAESQEGRAGGANIGMWIGVAVGLVGLFLSVVTGVIAVIFAVTN